MFSAIWNQFYNAVIRNVNPFVKGGIILSLVMIALFCIIKSAKKGAKEKLVGDWFLFFFGILLILLALVYTFVSA